ncbi:hypothetical protein EU803_06215 [Loktanella sp. IMCC34160]|uniref:hypothetical protein n=1 Tax=Loktanella sp. IMCC34160 TaxID=2510646 RepID=UPI00101BBBA1|nr:hypothetical protein [Loktanella sp. IMCC34160]RYG92038.1 hypothetical protein EU803_06215 [Loktanella sp. IMCC34160]
MALHFEVTNTGPFPYLGNDEAVALTVAKVSGDPMVLYLNQTTYEDPITYLSLALDHTYKEHDNPPGWNVISGFAFDPIRNIVACANGTTNMHQVMAFDPVTEQAVADIDLSLDDDIPAYAEGIGTNGFFFIRGGGNRVELRSLSGVKLGQRDYPGRNISGASAAGIGWLLADKNADEIVVLDPFGNERGTVPAPGAPGGLDAVAFDYVVNHEYMPQVIPPSDGSAPGDYTIPWNPAPWIQRHRIYVANSVDHTIYAGYIYET